MAIRDQEPFEELHIALFEALFVRKIAETVGYHCGAVVVKQERMSDGGIGPDSVAEENLPVPAVPSV